MSISGLGVRKRKYSRIRSDTVPILSGIPAHVDKEFISAAYSTATWRRLSSAIQSMKNFAQHTCIEVTWPFSESILHKYITWAFDKEELSSATIKAYINDFSTLHKMKNLDNSIFDSFLIKTALKGAVNIELYKNVTKKCKSTMDLDLLKKIGNQIAKSSMSAYDKQVYWVACTLAFWGSFRMGELLEKTETEISAEAISWSDVIDKDDSLSVHVKIPKIKSKKGDNILIFEFKGHNVCPVKAFKQLKSMARTSASEHIFVLGNGTNLTMQKFTNNLKIWAAPYRSAEFIKNLSGHSFRNAIPSVLASRPDLAEEDDICTWGRWNSLAFKIYARASDEAKRSIFRKICRAISDSIHRPANGE